MSASQLSMLFVGVLAVCGGVYLQRSQTYHEPASINHQLHHFTQQLETIPTEFGDWKSQELSIDEDRLRASCCDGAKYRLFENKVTGHKLSVFLATGHGYHITIHTPDFSYGGSFSYRGYSMDEDPASFRFDAPGLPENEVLHALFAQSAGIKQTRILWAYSKGDSWKSPKENAKYIFGDEKAMYKIYVTRDFYAYAPPIEEDEVTIGFAKEFLPVLNEALFASDPPN